MTGTAVIASPGALDARMRVRRGSFELDASIAVQPGEVVAVLGPNGAGKSTLLGVLAGLIAPDEGAVTLGGRLLTGPGALIPTERRRVGLMGQDPLLFPHLSAVENIAFGPRSQGRGRQASRRLAASWLDRLGLSGMGSRRPQQLSGGQRQRVALARALAAEPELLLLDEPMGSLDVETAPETRQLLRSHLRGSGVSTVLVTHDVLDAAMLADRVTVLVDGSVVDSGPTARVLAAPRSAFSAALAGLNLLPGEVSAGGRADAPVRVRTGGTTISGLAAEPVTAGDTAAAVFPPSAVAVYTEPVAGSPRNSWPATVTALEPGPTAIRVRATLDSAVVAGWSSEDSVTAPVVAADLTPASVAELDLQPGSRVFLSVKATEVRIHRR